LGTPRAVALERDLLARVAEQVGEGVAVFDNDDWLIYANPVLAAMHGCDAADLVGRHLATFVNVAEASHDRSHAPASGDGITRAEMSSRRLDGSPADVEVTVSFLRDDRGEPVGRIVCLRDVSIRKELERRLERAALHDPLTDLPNRRLLSDRLEHALAAAERSSTAVAVLFIDLDGFKRVNDTHGHAVGDQLLIQTADRFKACLRDADTLARFGGDEFVVLLEHVTDPDQPAVTARRLTDALMSPFDLDGIQIEISASIGMALSTSGTHRSLLHTADSAMYEAKSAGPGRIVASQWETTTRHTRTVGGPPAP
jgi:diguanylate cyclase (GGDEF)-like protein/PAS domain S-box-containing protein